MKTTFLEIGSIPAVLYGETAEGVYLFVHGKNGFKEEAADLAALACPKGWQVLAVDLPGHGARKAEGGYDPWHAVPELQAVMGWIKERWGRVALRATSLGAWFSLLAFPAEPLERCLFVSPVLDMARLISDMMGWAGVTEEMLREAGTIETAFGETLSWEYLTYARAHPIKAWDIPTAILYGENDDLTGRATMDGFAEAFHASLYVMADGEHWFHTPEQLAVLGRWTAEHI